MKILIDIPDENIPTQQDILNVDLYFIDGIVCGCTYPFEMQEPCEDCISRMLEQIDKSYAYFESGDVRHGFDICKDIINKELKEMPPVRQPKQRTGYWVQISKEKYVQHAMSYYKCDKCNGQSIGQTAFCPNCGAKMKEGD